MGILGYTFYSLYGIISVMKTAKSYIIALWFLLRYFPRTLPIIVWYAIKERRNPGDLALIAIKGAVIPTLIFSVVQNWLDDLELMGLNRG